MAVGIRSRIDTGVITRAINREEQRLKEGITMGMGDATDDLKQAFRDQVRGAGLGSRLAQTWQDNVYPLKYRKYSMHPTGYIWSNAPEIIDFYDSGRNIVPIGGQNYLAIPTPRARAMRGRKGARQSVAEVLARLGKRLVIIPGKRGAKLGLIDDSLPPNGRRRTGVKRNLVLLYTFVPMVRGQKRFDVRSLVKSFGATIPGRIAQRLSE